MTSIAGVRMGREKKTGIKKRISDKKNENSVVVDCVKLKYKQIIERIEHIYTLAEVFPLVEPSSLYECKLFLCLCNESHDSFLQRLTSRWASANFVQFSSFSSFIAYAGDCLFCLSVNFCMLLLLFSLLHSLLLIFFVDSWPNRLII